MQDPKEIQVFADLPPQQVDIGEYVWRPKSAAISCGHLWGGLLIIAGLAETIVGAVLFVEWRGTGGVWVGVVAISAGVAGACMKRSRRNGGAPTVFFMALTFLSFLAALFSVIIGDGLAYLVVTETEGNCYDSIVCTGGTCADADCVCWEPDGSESCEDGQTLRYCISYAGSNCKDIGDSRDILFGSSIMLLLILVMSFFALLVSIATCFCCKRLVQNPHGSSMA